MFQIVDGPPVREPALRVTLTAEIVEAMPSLVTDGRTDGFVVVGSIGVGIEEWRLNNRGGEVESILKRNVQRIHDLRLHPPFVPIHGLMKFRELTAVFEKLRPLDVAQRVALRDLQRRVILPTV